MSGLLPDLASWALRGQPAAAPPDDDTNTPDDDNTTNTEQQSPQDALTPQEMRAQRVQRMDLLRQERLEQQQQQQQQQEAASDETPSAKDKNNNKNKNNPQGGGGVEPMNVDTPTTTSSSSSSKPVADSSSSSLLSQKKKRRSEKETSSNEARKFQRKKQVLVRKVLGLVLVDAASNSSSNHNNNKSNMEWMTTMEVEDASDISVQTIAEVLSNRVAAAASPDESSSNSSSHPKKSLLAYLAECFRLAADELKTLAASSSSSSTTTKATATVQQQTAELTELLQEIQKQVVSYAATILVEPTLFEQGQDSMAQLSDCLLLGTTTTTMDVTRSITFGSPSFYHLLVDELQAQDPAALQTVVTQLVDSYQAALKDCDSVLDHKALPSLLTTTNNSSTSNVRRETSPLAIVSALTSLCLHKKVAELVAQSPSFLLPPASSPQAQEKVRPPAPPPPVLPTPPTGTGGSTNRLLQQFMTHLAQQQQQQSQTPPYCKRSGPGLEHGTLMGSCLRLGIPTKHNPAFSPSTIVRQSFAVSESATSQQRQQLNVYQQACQALVQTFIKAGPTSRQCVLDWFTDALLVNVGASATRPDPTKVSSASLLLNLSASLLHLCQPFVSNPAKHGLIDPLFCADPAAHKGLYATTGDNAVPRLSSSSSTETDDDTTTMAVEYQPKNAFVTQLFFLTARAIHLGLSAQLSQHESLLRHLSHLHWHITSRGSATDWQTDPQFALYVSRQRSAEVALLADDFVASHLHFLQLQAKLVCTASQDVVAQWPEELVSDVCHVVTLLAKLKPKLLRGIDMTYTFQQVVKLLSPTYATMVRNYNLRAMLGDVLYELFLPPSTDEDRRDSVPTSVYLDSKTGETYLLSDPSAQECLAPSLLLLYGEVEHTGYYDRMSHRAKISSLIKYLWESKEHRPAFRRITQNKQSFIKFANGIMNETNTLIATVMQKLPEIREAQLKMKNTAEWSAMTEEQQKQVSERLEENEREVKHALPLCNKTLQMFGYLNTDPEIRQLFLLEELSSRLVSMLLHVLTKLVGSKGLELKVDNPEELDFKPKVMLRDLCYIFSLFAAAPVFQEECAKSGCDPRLLRQALSTVTRLHLLEGEQLQAFSALPEWMEQAAQRVAQDELLVADAPEEFLDEILSTFMKDPVWLPSGHVVDRSTITQHLLNDPMDPFNRKPLSIEEVKPATELKQQMTLWLEEKRQKAAADAQTKSD